MMTISYLHRVIPRIFKDSRGQNNTRYATKREYPFTIDEKSDDDNTANCIEGYNVLRKMTIVTGSAYINYFRSLKADDDRSTEEYVPNEEIVVTVLAYFNFLRCQTKRDKEPNMC